MRFSKTALIVLLSALVGAGLAAQGMRGGGGTRIQPGQECPPGTTETRPQTCQAPSEPAPSILDYRPRSTLVTAEHKVPKAKFPVIDVHSHQGQLTLESMKELVSTMDPLNVRVLTLADNLSGDRLVKTVEAINASPYKDRFRALAGIDFRNVGPGWADKAIAQLRADIKAGALGVGEVGKQFGLRITKPDGSRLHVDDPEIDPLWDEFARLDVPVFIHTAEPQEFFQPQDMHNELYDFGRQPRAAHDFFVKYQDRILFGKDSYQPNEFPYYWRVFETNDEYFDYYRDYHAFWKMYGMGLPDEVLKKVYYKNTLRVFKGMPTTGWPQ